MFRCRGVVGERGKRGSWRASEASETLFSHDHGSSSYVYVRQFHIRMRI